MRDGLILLLPSMESGPLMWGHWLGDEIVETGQTTLAQVGALSARGLPVHLVIPGQNAQSFAHNIPKMRRREREKAVLYAVEDNLSVPFDTLHLALQDGAVSSVVSGDDVAAADNAPSLNLATIISRRIMEEAKDWVDQNGLNVQSIVTDYDALTESESTPLILADRVVFAGPMGHALDLDWYDGPVNTADINAILNAVGTRLPSANNLMQGEFAPQSAMSGAIKNWMQIGALAACLGLAVLVFNAFEARALGQQAQDVRAQTARIYTQLTGEAAPENPARTVTQAARGGNVAPTQFLILSDIAFRALAEFDDVAIERLSFQDSRNELQLRLSYPSFEQAEAVQRAMNGEGGDFIPGGVREQSGRFVGEAVLKMQGAS